MADKDDAGETTRARGPDGRFPPGNGVHGLYPGPASGKGWGGPANGAGTAPLFTAESQPTPEAKSEGKAVARTAREAAKPHAASMVDIWLEVAKDPEQPAMARIAAAERIVDRAEGRPMQSTEITGADRGPIQVETTTDARVPLDAFLGEFAGKEKDATQH